MAEVGAVKRKELGVERRALGVGRERVERVVALASEIELLREDLAQIFGAANSAGLPLVDERRILAARGKDLEGLQHLVGAFGESTAIAARQVDEHVVLQIGRVVIFERFAVALFPMRDEVAVEVARPGNTALHEGEGQLGKPFRYAAEEKSAAHRVGARGEIAEMIVDVVGRRRTAAPSVTNGMEGR